MSTLATLAFIGAAAAAGSYLATRPTVADGRVMAADLRDKLEPMDKATQNVTSLECDRSIPITAAGATFRCLVGASDGSTATLQYVMDHEGALSWRMVDSSGPSVPQAPTTGDPWRN